MKNYFIDTNIFLRFLTADNKEKYNKCKQLFQRAVFGKELLITSDLVIAEIIWTLLSFYKIPKQEVIEKVTIILNTPNLKIENHKLINEALLLFSLKNLDFIDAYNSTYIRQKQIDGIYSYDRDFDKVDFLERLEP
ncbi:MAG: PIN domain-containing protein [Candidatus Schekmanbacteria bacterium]|nr:PIN domain-containing protein [Candidatus Schekmanbacteria bacterium]